MSIINKFRESAGKINRKIVLPEGEEERIIRAAGYLSEQKLVKPILIGRPSEIMSLSKSLDINLDNVEIHDPQNSSMLKSWAEEFYILRKHKNITEEEALSIIQDPLFFGAFMVKKGLAMVRLPVRLIQPGMS